MEHLKCFTNSANAYILTQPMHSGTKMEAHNGTKIEAHSASKMEALSWRLDMFSANLDDLVKSMQTWPTWKWNFSTNFKRPSNDIKVSETLISPYNLWYTHRKLKRYQGEGLTWYCPSISRRLPLGQKKTKWDPCSLGTPHEHFKLDTNSANA